MNKLDRIKNLENELESLKADIIEEEKVKSEKWNPIGQDYVINLSGQVLKRGYALSIDRDIVNNGLYFDNEKQAQQASIAYRRYHRLYRLALELNGDDYNPDWGSGENKYFIESNDGYLTINSRKHMRNVSGIYFKTETLAQKAIDIIGDELL